MPGLSERVPQAGRHVENVVVADATAVPEPPSVAKAVGFRLGGDVPVDAVGAGGGVTLQPPLASGPGRAEEMASPPPPPPTSSSGETGLAAPKLPPMPTLPGSRVKAAPPPAPETLKRFCTATGLQW